MDVLIQGLVDGIITGGIYALVSVGLVLVYGVVRIVNFAQGEFLMLGVYGAYFAWKFLGVDPLAAALVVGALIAAIGYVFERLLIEPIVGASHLAQIFITVAAGIIIMNAAAVSFGTSTVIVTTPYSTKKIDIGPAIVSFPRLFAFVGACVMALSLHLIVRHTRLGKQIRATAQNRYAAVLCGMNVRRISALAFALAVGLTGVAGALLVSYTAATPTVGQNYIIIMFTVMVLGGLSSIHGALVGGLMVGLTQAISVVYMPIALQNVPVFAIFIVALLAIHRRRSFA